MENKKMKLLAKSLAKDMILHSFSFCFNGSNSIFDALSSSLGIELF